MIYIYTNFWAPILYNPLGSRSEQGRPEGPILRVDLKLPKNLVDYNFQKYSPKIQSTSSSSKIMYEKTVP